MKKINMYKLTINGELKAAFINRANMIKYLTKNNINGGVITYKDYNMTINRFIKQHYNPALYVNNKLKRGILNE